MQAELGERNILKDTCDFNVSCVLRTEYWSEIDTDLYSRQYLYFSVFTNIADIRD